MEIREILEAYSRGEIDIDEAEKRLRLDFLQKIGDHTIFDHARSMRRGIPEIIFGESKTPKVLAEIVSNVIENRELVLISRATPDHYRAVEKAVGDIACWKEKARMIVIDRRKKVEKIGKIGIMAAGTSDVTVAEEAREVAEAMGCHVITAYDVGVAGFHRILEPLSVMIEEGCDALVVVAGMEGALPVTISGLVDVPVIGVPSSVGYGKGGLGEAALLSMLQTCSPGLVCVNIDNGVNAGATAALISLRCRRSAQYRR